MIIDFFFGYLCFSAWGTHDATHMRSLEYLKKLIRRRILEKPSINIKGETIKPYIIGD